MSALVFGNYCITGNENDSFDVGHCPILDGYDGFFDQSFEHSSVGDQLFFMLWDGEELTDLLKRLRQKVTLRDSRDARDRLHQARIISGTIIETDSSSFARIRVENSELFGSVYARKPNVDNESIEEVERVAKIWSSIRSATEQMGDSYRYRLPCQLPSISAVLSSIRSGFVCSCDHYYMENFLFLEPLTNDTDKSVRVVVLGSHDIDSSRIFDITSLEDYESSIQSYLDEARLEKEIAFWSYLLK